MLTGTEAAGTIAVALSDSSDKDKGIGIGVGVAAIILKLSSAIYGGNQVRACRDYNAYRQRLRAARRRRGGPTPVPTTPPAPIAPPAPATTGPACEHDAQCREPLICEAFTCVPDRGEP